MKRSDFWEDKNTGWYNSFKIKAQAQAAVNQLRKDGYIARIRYDPKQTGWRGAAWHKEYPYAVWYKKGASRAKRSAPKRQGVDKMAKIEIEIDGKTYVEHIGEYTKAIANEKAADIRKRGYSCRVIKTGKGWTVYARREK